MINIILYRYLIGQTLDFVIHTLNNTIKAGDRERETETQ